MSKEKEENAKKIVGAIKRKLVTRMKNELVPLGFAQTSSTFWNRYTKTMRHSFEFLQRHWCEFCVRRGFQILDPFGTEEHNSHSYSNTDDQRWYRLPKDIDDVDKFLDKVMLHIKQVEEKFFSQYQEAAQLIRDYELKKIPKEYFSESICWRNYNMGIAYFHAGKYAQAIRHFQKVIDSYSKEPLDFVQARKASAEKWIKKIKKMQ